MVLQLLAEAVGQPREPALRHPQAKVLPFDKRRAQVRRVADHGPFRYRYYLGRRVAPGGVARRSGWRAVTLYRRSLVEDLIKKLEALKAFLPDGDGADGEQEGA
ncbi:MAG: hypothetical protein KGO51_01960 [Alphaproteobacteria bacterium]|nr:hypothetical protein [Alphaproteobacteria bacterium]